MYLPVFTLVQQFAIAAFVTFTVALWQNRLILWCLFPLLTFAFKKYCGSVFANKKSVYNSTWLLAVVKIVGSMQRTFSSLLCRSELVGQKVIYGGNSKNLQSVNSVWKESDKMLMLLGRDFVHSWFQYISTNDNVSEELTAVLKSLRSMLFNRLGSVNRCEVLKDYVNLYQKHLKLMTSAQNFLRKQPNIRHRRNREQEFKKLKTILDVMREQNKLHVALKSDDFEMWHLQSVFDSCFMELLEFKLYNSDLPRKVIRDIVVHSVLQPFMDFLSQPYWLHFIIINLTSDEELEQCHAPVETESIHQQTIKDKNNYVAEDHSTTSSHYVIQGPAFNNNESKIENTMEDSCMNDEAVIDHDMARPLFELGCSTDETLEDDSSDIIEVAEDVSLNVSSNLEKPDKIFIELSFSNTEKVQEQRSGSVYTIYCMEYLAWHQNEEGGWNVRQGLAKRRFREFLTLHERLEDHSALKPHLKGIKGPTKWMTFSLSNLDEEIIKKRKTHLETYMKQLVGDTELSNSLAVREFLAYEGDTSIAFVKRPSELYKINQVMINTVKRVKSNVLDKLKPSSGQLVPSAASYNALPDTTAMWTDGVDPNSLNVTCVASQCLISAIRRTPQLKDNCNEAYIMIKDPNSLNVTCVASQEENHMQNALAWVIEDFEEQMQELYEEEDVDFFDVLDSSFLGSFKKTEEGCGLDREVPLASSLLDLALQTVSERECWVRDEVAVRLAKLTIGKFLDEFVRSELDDAFTPERCTYYMELIRETIWPGGVLDTSVYTPSPEQCAVTRNQAKRCLHNFFPGFLPYVIGRETFDYSVDQVMNSLDDPILNKHFAYQLLDLMLMHICPSITTPSVQTQLLQSNDLHTVTHKREKLNQL